MDKAFFDNTHKERIHFPLENFVKICKYIVY